MFSEGADTLSFRSAGGWWSGPPTRTSRCSSGSPTCRRTLLPSSVRTAQLRRRIENDYREMEQGSGQWPSAPILVRSVRSSEVETLLYGLDFRGQSFIFPSRTGLWARGTGRG